MAHDSGGPRQRLFSRERRRRARLPISLVMLAALIVLFSLITPADLLTTINPGSVRVPTGTPTATARPSPTSVHGGTIVFTCTRKNVNQICLINADGTGYEQLTSGDSNSYYPAVSRDGQAVVFVVNKGDYFDLFRMTLSAAPGLQRPAPSIDQISFYIGNAFSPSLSPDGKQVIFVNRVTDHPDTLWVTDVDGKNARPLYSAPSEVVGAAWSRDGNTVAMTMTAGQGFQYEVFLLGLGELSAAPRQISHGLSGIGGSISWSADQKDLLIFAGPVSAREIYRLDIQTGATTQLTFGGNNASAAYSPDGQYIVFNSLRNQGQADLYVMRADGHSLRRLTDNPEPDWQPQWGP